MRATRPEALLDDEIASQQHELLELFFDLVFAFAVSQLSHHLFAHLSWRGAAETLVMLLATLTVWTYTSWAATMIATRKAGTHWMLLSVMLLGLFMNASLTRAFTESSWPFVAPLLVIQLGRTIWTLVYTPSAYLKSHYERVLVWLLATTPLWIGGALSEPGHRLGWWGAAAGIEFVGTGLGHVVPGHWLRSEHIEFNADHMMERCRLFLIIALGETVLTTGAALASGPVTPMAMLTGASAFVGTVALWALSFGRSHRLIARHLEETTDPIRAGRYAVGVLMALVAGLVAVAVANGEALANPEGITPLGVGLLMVGGPILFLAAQAWYQWTVLDVKPRLHLVGVAALVLLGSATPALPAFAASMLVSGSLTVLALLDSRQTTRSHNPQKTGNKTL